MVDCLASRIRRVYRRRLQVFDWFGSLVCYTGVSDCDAVH